MSLQTIIQQIKTASLPGENTALRVGSAFEQMDAAKRDKTDSLSKEETIDMVNSVKLIASTGTPFLGTIDPATTILAGNFWAFASEGTYANAGGIVVGAGEIAIITRVGTAFDSVILDVPVKSIDDIQKTSTVGLVDTYTITYTDGSAPTTFQVTNGAATPISAIFNKTTKTEAQGGFQIDAYNTYDNYLKGFRVTGNLSKGVSFKQGYYLDLNGNEQVNAAAAYSDLIPIKALTKYTQNVTQIRNFYDKDKNHLIGIAGNTNTWESPANAVYVSLVVLTAYLPTFALVEGTNISNGLLYSEATVEGVLNPVWNIIQHSDTSYNAVRTLAEKLRLESNSYNRYEIYLSEGTYTETDWKGFGKYVRIKGENRDGTFINFDGNSSNILPDDYSFGIFSGQVASSVERGAKHIVFLMRDFHCENLTFFADNCKYPIHSDNAGFKKAEFLNCRIKEKNCNYPIGIGIWGGQSLRFENCILEREHFHTRHHAFLYHNSTEQIENSLVEFKNCKMLQCGGAVVYENGSNREDILNIINCQTDSVFEIEYGVSQDADGKTFWTNHISGVKVENPANIPYNIKLNTLGSNIDLIYDSPYFVGFPSSRPLFYKHIVSDYIGLSQNFEAVQKGDLLSKIGDAGHNSANRTVKYNSAVLSLPPIGVALHDAGVNEPLYFSKVGKIGKVKFSGGGISNYDGNTRKLVFNETSKVFESNHSISWKIADAIAYENTAVDGLLMALVKSF